MQHAGLTWKKRVVVVVAVSFACVPMLAHADEAPVTRLERTPAYEVMLTIGPAQGSSSMTIQPADTAGMATTDDMSMGGGHMGMQPHEVDQGLPVNHWVDVHITHAGAGGVLSDVTPTIRILDKSTGEARDLPGVMGMSGGMSASDFHYGQNVYLPEGTYQVSVLLGPAETAQFRDVMVASSPMMTSEPAMEHDMNAGEQMRMIDEPDMHP